MNDEYIASSYKMIRLVFNHEGKPSERLIRNYIQQMIVTKKKKALSVSSDVNDREDVRVSLEGVKVSFSSPGNETVPPANVTAYMVDMSAGGACIKIPSNVKVAQESPCLH